MLSHIVAHFWVVKQESTCCGVFKKYMFPVFVHVCSCCCSVMFHVLLTDEVFPSTVASASQHMSKYGCIQTGMFDQVKKTHCVDFIL